MFVIRGDYMKIKGDKDYSEIMNLPKKTIPTDGNLPQRQEYFLEKIQCFTLFLPGVVAFF